MDNPDTFATLGTQNTGQINVRENRRGNQEWTIQRYWQHQRKPKMLSRMDNPETLATLEKTEEVIKNGQSRDIGNIRENRRRNQEWTIQRYWQHQRKPKR